MFKQMKTSEWVKEYESALQECQQQRAAEWLAKVHETNPQLAGNDQLNDMLVQSKWGQ